jgi:hypothetical protein
MNIFPMGPSATAYVSSEPEEGVTENNIKTAPHHRSHPRRHHAVKAVPRQVRADGVALPAEAGAVAVVKIDVRSRLAMLSG